MSREFSELPDWLKKGRTMVWIIPHTNFLDSKGYKYPYNDVPEELRDELYKEFRDAKKTNQEKGVKI